MTVRCELYQATRRQVFSLAQPGGERRGLPGFIAAPREGSEPAPTTPTQTTPRSSKWHKKRLPVFHFVPKANKQRIRAAVVFAKPTQRSQPNQTKRLIPLAGPAERPVAVSERSSERQEHNTPLARFKKDRLLLLFLVHLVAGAAAAAQGSHGGPERFGVLCIRGGDACRGARNGLERPSRPGLVFDAGAHQ